MASSSAAISQGARTRAVIGYAALAFVLGLGQGSLIPLIPNLARGFHVTLPAVLFIVSLIGWASLIGTIPAVYGAFRWGGQSIVWATAIVLSLGLILRAAAGGYTLFAVGWFIAALTLPFVYSPVGAVIRDAQMPQLRAWTSAVIGSMPIGVGFGSLGEVALLHSVGFASSEWILAAIAVAVSLYAVATSGALRRTAGVEVERPRIRIQPSLKWVAAFCIFGLVHVIQGSLTPAVAHVGVHDPRAVGGLLGASLNWGAAVFTIGLGIVGEYVKDFVAFIRLAAVVFALAAALLLANLTGAIAFSVAAANVSAVVTGGLSFAVFSLISALAVQENRAAGHAGVATGMISLSANMADIVLIPTLGTYLVVGGWVAGLVAFLLIAVGVVCTFSRGIAARPAEAGMQPAPAVAGGR